MYSATPEGLLAADSSGVFACDNDERNLAKSYERIISYLKNFCKPLITLRGCDKIFTSLSDPTVVVLGKGVITVKKQRKRTKKRVREIVKRIVESVIGRFIYDVLKKIFQDND